jgi:hypothetical protein
MKTLGSFRLTRLPVLAVIAGCFLLSGCGDSSEWWYVNTNSRPVADAGPDQAVLTGDTVTLDGTGSTDKDGNQLTYSWSISQKPAGSAAVLSGSSSATPSFVADMDGEYLIELVVSDGKISSAADTVTVTATNTLGYDYAPGEAYAWLAYGESPELSEFTGFVKVNLTSGAITPIMQLFDSSTFMAGADFVKGRYLCVQHSTNKLFYINGDGTYEEITTLAGVNTIIGLSYDPAADKIYVADYTGSGTVLRAISTTDFSVTLVGTISSEIIIGLASDASGTLYGVSLDADNLYRIDTATGTGTIVGPLGININYAQGIAFDRTNNILYGTLYSSGGGVYTINTTTGAATLVAPLGGDLDGFAIPPQPLNPPI